MKKLCAVFGLGLASLSLAGDALAEPMVISGRVTSKADGLPLPGATVQVAPTGPEAVSDAKGQYSLAVPAERTGQKVELRVAANGFRAETATVESSATVSRDFGLALSFGEEVVVGSRASGADAEKAVPVDIVTRERLESAGATETAQILQTLVPSFNFPRTTMADGADTARPATLRGLGPDQTLVLIGGKRRHTMAHIPTTSAVGRGSTGVNFNAIPASAVERVEVLRDGAAAQYGSDAIAGVVNVVPRSGASPLTLSLKGGSTLGHFVDMTDRRRSHSDGEMVDASASYGFRIGRGGVFASAEYRDRNGTNRASPDLRDQITTGDANTNTVAQPNHHWGDSDERAALGFVNGSYPLNADGTTNVYAFGGVSRREGSHGGFYRRGLDNRNWPTIYPEGYLPLIEPEDVDASATVGVRGIKAGWVWDASAQYGRNSFDLNIRNSLNVSMGPNQEKRDFYSGSMIFAQLTSNLDVTRAFEVGLAGPLNVAMGAELRRENFRIIAGEPDSWRDGGSKNQFGQQAEPGVQVLPGFRPGNEVDAFRNNLAGYVDVEGNLVAAVRMGVAARFEHYDDFGGTADGKVTLRVTPHRRVVLRGAASTGFRAPSLVQSHYSSVTTSFINSGGVVTPTEVGTFAVASPVAQVLGATALKAENSVNLSVGLVLEPLAGMSFSADFYQIDIDDRIVWSGNFTGAQIQALVRPFGANAARFFTNAIDTRTRGVDLSAGYRLDLRRVGTVRLWAAYNQTDTNIMGEVTTPPQLASFGNVLFDRTQIELVTCGQPKDNVRLSADWTRNAFSGIVRANRYGEYCTLSSSASNEQRIGADWVTDVEMAFKRKHYTLALGAQNVFDVFPDRLLPANSSFGIQTYSSRAPYGMNGRFLYAQATYRF